MATGICFCLVAHPIKWSVVVDWVNFCLRNALGNALSLQFYLIDYENIQPDSVGLLRPGTCRFKVFLGQNQSKLPLELLQALQPFGADVDYLRINGNGPNAVDFHIAFYIGRLTREYPDASFCIVSRDTGFDPLVRHLLDLKVACKRIASLPGAIKPASASAKKVPLAKPEQVACPSSKPTTKVAKNVMVTVSSANGAEPSSKATKALKVNRSNEVLARLKGLKAARPATVKTLHSSVRSWFKPALDAKELVSIVQSLVDKKKITVTGSKVTYSLG